MLPSQPGTSSRIGYPLPGISRSPFWYSAIIASSSALLTGTLRLGASESAPSATSHLAFGSMPASSSSVESITPVHSAQDTRPWMRLHVGVDWFLRGQERAVAAALDERHARHHRIAHERIEREDERPAHEPVNHETVPVGIDVGVARVRNDEVQAVRRDRALRASGGRARLDGSHPALAVAEGHGRLAHHLLTASSFPDHGVPAALGVDGRERGRRNNRSLLDATAPDCQGEPHREQQCAREPEERPRARGPRQRPGRGQPPRPVLRRAAVRRRCTALPAAAPAQRPGAGRAARGSRARWSPALPAPS